jgi:hypothetical protein
MKKKLVLSAMPVALLALGLAVTGCLTEDDDDSSSSSGGSVPSDLQGMWLLDDAGGTQRYLRFNGTNWSNGEEHDHLAADDSELQMSSLC